MLSALLVCRIERLGNLEFYNSALIEKVYSGR